MHLVFTASPGLNGRLDDFFHSQYILIIWAEVPAIAVLLMVTVHFRRQPEVAGNRFHDMLPGPGGNRVADHDAFVLYQRTDAIRHQSVQSPVSAAYHVAGAG